jgi:putative phage-type endonuclease
MSSDENVHDCQVGPTLISTQDRASWLASRRMGIGSSDAAILAGEAPPTWGSPYTLYQQKLGAELELPTTLRMRAGIVLEPLVRELWQEETGQALRYQPWELFRSRRHPYMTASLDGLIQGDHTRGLGLFEAKTVDPRVWETWGGALPTRYVIQTQHAMHVLETTWGEVAVLIGTERLERFPIEVDPELIGMIVELEARFWRRVEQREPPPADGSPGVSEYLKQRYPRPTPGARIALPAPAASWAAQYRVAKDELKAWEAVKAESENALRAELGDAEVGELPGGGEILVKAIEVRASSTQCPACHTPVETRKAHTRRSLELVGVQAKELVA